MKIDTDTEAAEALIALLRTIERTPALERAFIDLEDAYEREAEEYWLDKWNGV
jgi:hypothetical protein